MDVQGDHNAIGHNAYYHISPSLALIQKEYKYIYWPQNQVMSNFTITHKIHSKSTTFSRHGPNQPKALVDMEARYAHLKNINGHAVKKKGTGTVTTPLIFIYIEMYE
jgi:hypothetical protein